MECAIGHFQRTEQAPREEIPQALARRRFDHAAQQIAREAVLPDCARLMRERYLRQSFHLLPRRQVARVELDVGLEQSGLEQGFLYRRVLGDFAVGEPCGVAQQVMHGHFAIGCAQAISRAGKLGVGFRNTDLQ